MLSRRAPDRRGVARAPCAQPYRRALVPEVPERRAERAPRMARSGSPVPSDPRGSGLARTVAELRKNWRSRLVLAVLVAVAGGACMAAAIGARRTETAYPRL